MSALTSTVFSYQKPIAIAVEKNVSQTHYQQWKYSQEKKKKVTSFLLREEKKKAC